MDGLSHLYDDHPAPLKSLIRFFKYEKEIFIYIYIYIWVVKEGGGLVICLSKKNSLNAKGEEK